MPLGERSKREERLDEQRRLRNIAEYQSQAKDEESSD
jgi:hypothetical protein